MKFEKYLYDFKDYLEVHNYSGRTIETYSGGIKQFLSFLEKYYSRVNSLEKITKDIIWDYQSYLANFKNEVGDLLANKTQSLKLRAVKRFFSFLIKKDYILKDPSTIITFPKEEQRLTRNILSEDEVFDLLKKLKPIDPVSIRNRAIVELFYSCGMRTSELCNIKLQDVNLKEQTITIVKGKGNKSRVVPIGQYASYYIELYLNKSRKYMLRGKRDDPGYLFLSLRGNPFDKSSINKCVMRSIMHNRYVSKPISCYTFRHTIATHLLQNRVDIMYIAKLLGHASLRTTQRYLRVDITDLKKMHSLYHPRENKTLTSNTQA